LVVEDDDATRELIVRGLSTEFAVYAASNAEQALALVARMPPPAAIITDVMMPGMDGFQFARTVKALPTCKNVPILFLTARDAPGDVVKGINAGARHYMTKPFKAEDLLDKARKMTKG
jgi:DNA-binding response OmpR family regulator